MLSYLVFPLSIAVITANHVNSQSTLSYTPNTHVSTLLNDPSIISSADTPNEEDSQTVTTSTSVSNNNNSLIINEFEVVIVIISSILLLAAVLFAFVAKMMLQARMRQRQRLRTSQSHTMPSKDQLTSPQSKFAPSSFSAISRTSNVTQVSNFSTNSQSTIKAEPGLSIPAFLRYNDGEHFKKTSVLAHGGYGIVYIGQAKTPELLKTGNRIVIKQIQDINSQRSKDAFYQELSILYFLREHKNIVQVLGFCESPFAFILKFYNIGMLSRYLWARGTKVTKQMQVKFLKNISKGLSYMMINGIAHCDLKSDNILIDYDIEKKELFCVISDFGLSCIVDDKLLNIDGFRNVHLRGVSISYASPESIVKLKLREMRKTYPFPYHPLTSDLYSFSIIMHDMLTRKKPWNKNKNQKIPEQRS